MKLLVTAALGLAMGAGLASPVQADDQSAAAAQRPDPLELYLAHHATPNDTGQASAAFVGQTADGRPVVGHTPGPLPPQTIPPDDLAAAAAMALSGNAAMAEAPARPER